MRLPYLALVLCLVLLGCESKPKVSAQQMKRTLQSNVYNFNKDVSGLRFDDAKSYVAPAADAQFEKVVAELNAKQYNLLMSDEPPQIDYLNGEAQVPVRLLLGENSPEGRPRPGAKEVGKRMHLWRYNNGGWQWYGVSAQ